jgi:DNA-binding transcriptional ArsR family regulator
MLTIALDADQLSTSRFVVSPLLHVVESMIELSRARPGRVTRGWLRRARSRLMASDLGPDVALLAELVSVRNWYVPDFLTPVPATSAPSVDDELHAVASTSPDRIRFELGLTFRGDDVSSDIIDTRAVEQRRRPVPARLASALAGGERCLAQRVAHGLRRYWDVVLAPDWPLVQTVLDEDLIMRGRLLTRNGAATLFSDLHRAITWDGRLLRVDGPYDLDLSGNTTGVVLAPSVFCAPTPFCCIESPSRLMLCYPARGSGTFWHSCEPEPTSVPSGLLGRRRVGLLADLGVPRALHHLAVRQRLSPSTVSYHLRILRGAGLVESRRSGKEMLYERTSLAVTVLETIGPARQDVRLLP